MMIYLAKFILCSGLFYLTYLLLFEKERMNQFKRFYLLSSLLLSFIIPLITLESNIEIAPVEALYSLAPSADPIISQTTIISTIDPAQTSTAPYLILGVYMGITSLLLSRFIKNMIALVIKIKKGKKVSWQGIILILNDKESATYSFMNYIFVSQKDYENHKIHEGILQHELAHVKQKHSIDVVLIELLQIFLWFNPLLYFYRKAIQTNHEYLADESVIHCYQDINTYQLVLINYISTQNRSSLTSPFNYLTIKKRLIMMNKPNSLRTALGKQFLLLPVLATALFLFSTRTIAQEIRKESLIQQQRSKSYSPTKDGLNESEQKEYKALADKYFSLRDQKNIKTKLEQTSIDRLEVLYKKMNSDQQAKAMIFFTPPRKPMERKSPSAAQLYQWQDPKIYGVWVDGKRVENSKLNSFNVTDFNYWNSSKLSKNTVNYGKHYYQIDLMTKSYYQNYYDNTIKNSKSMMWTRQGHGLYTKLSPENLKVK